MSSPSLDDLASYVQHAESILYDHNTVLTYKQLAYQLTIPFNLAKHILTTVSHRAQKDGRPVITTYCIAGKDVETGGHTVCTINDTSDKFATIQQHFHQITSTYIHALTPTPTHHTSPAHRHSNVDVLNNIYDVNLKQCIELYEAGKWLDDNSFRSNTLSSIVNPAVKRRATQFTNVKTDAANTAKSKVEPLKTDKGTAVKEDKPQDVNQPVTLQQPVTAKPAKQPSKSNFFAAANASKPSVVPDTANVAANADKPVRTSPERKATSLIGMFQSQMDASKQVKAAAPATSPTAAKPTESMDVSDGEDDDGGEKTSKQVDKKQKKSSKSKSKKPSTKTSKKRKSVVDDDDEPDLNSSDDGGDEDAEMEKAQDDDDAEDDGGVAVQDPDKEYYGLTRNWVDPDAKTTGMDTFVRAGVDMHTAAKAGKQTKRIEQTYQNEKGYFVTEEVDVCVDCLQRQCECVTPTPVAETVVLDDDTKENDSVKVKAEPKLGPAASSKSTPSKKPAGGAKKADDKPAAKKAKTDAAEKPKPADKSKAAATKGITSFFSKK